MTRDKALLAVAFVCWLLAAVITAAPQLSADLGPAVAWFFGGFAAWALAHVIPPGPSR